jgi:hypothetical protein
MSSNKQIEANRRNAKKSTGARTAIGSAVSSRNARKHALTTVSHHNPLFAPQIEAMARAICSGTSNPRLWQEALTIGECTIVLRCVRAERIALIERLLGSAMISRRWRVWRAEAVECESKPSSPRDELEAMCLGRPGLDRLERYERRALSRRKRAVETLIAIQNNTPPSATTEGYRGFGTLACASSYIHHEVEL